jgi:hypothetical protein
VIALFPVVVSVALSVFFVVAPFPVIVFVASLVSFATLLVAFSVCFVVVFAVAVEDDVTALTVDGHVEQLVCGRCLRGLADGRSAGQLLLVAELEVFAGVADAVSRQTALVWARLLGQERHRRGGGCLPVSASGTVTSVIIVSADTACETDNRSRPCCPEHCTSRRVRCLLAGHC